MSQIIAELELSDYEKERGKPMPNEIHSSIQTQMIFLLKLAYREKYTFRSELTLATQPKTSTPDICVYTKRKVDVHKVKARTSDMPITTIEIQSPSQSIEELRDKALLRYFPMGVQSAWVVVPAMRGIQIFTPDGKFKLFNRGEAVDPVTGIALSIDEIFEELEY